MLDNTWVVGITGGIISSLIVFFITNFISAKVSKREYFKKIKTANGEVVNVLRQAISEGEFPHEKIIDSIINATSRKYEVETNDMYKGTDIIENLIKEVFDTSFISTDVKIESSNKLLKIKESYELAESVKEEFSLVVTQMERETERHFNSTLNLLAPLSSIIVIGTFLWLFMKDQELISLKDPNNFILVLTITTGTFSIVLIMLTIYRKNIKKRVKSSSTNIGNNN